MAASDVAQISASLRKNFLFATLSEEEIGELAGRVWVEQIPAGSSIVRESDPADALFVVVEGGVNVVKASGQFLAYLGPGGFFGEMALFIDGSRRTAHCVAVSDTACLVVRKDALDSFCTSHPAVGLKVYGVIIRTLAERLQATSADLAMIMGSQVKTQVGVAEMVAKAKSNRLSKP